MTEIHIVTRDNRDRYIGVLDRYHAVRHQVFVDERGWQALSRPAGRDIDIFDHDHAIHLLTLDGGRLVGGQRLYPTVLPHMLSEVFPQLVHLPRPRPRK